jgi:hypothetical protein
VYSHFEHFDTVTVLNIGVWTGPRRAALRKEKKNVNMRKPKMSVVKSPDSIPARR